MNFTAAHGIPYRLDDWRGELDPRTADELFGTLAERLAADGVVLDVGTGSGYVAMELAGRGVPIVAVDVVDWRASDVELPFALADACALPVATESCGGVHMARMLAHVGDWQQALAEIDRVLRPGGLFCLSLGGWFAEGPLREVEQAVREAAEQHGIQRAAVRADLRTPADVDAELARLGMAGPELVDVAGTLMRTPRQVIADVVSRADRWEAGQALSALYDIGADVMASLPMDLDEAQPQQEHITYRLYHKP